MKHFCAEISELGGFAIGNLRDRARFADQTRIGGEYAFDVGPNDDFVGVESGAKNGGGIIGAAAAESGEHAIRGRADKPGDDRYVASFEQRADAGMGARRVGSACGSAPPWKESVTISSVASMADAGDAHLRERGRKNRGAQAFAKTGNSVECARASVLAAERCLRRGESLRQEFLRCGLHADSVDSLGHQRARASKC